MAPERQTRGVWNHSGERKRGEEGEKKEERKREDEDCFCRCCCGDGKRRWLGS